MVDLEYFSSLNIWVGDIYRTISCKYFFDMVCTFKFSTKESSLLFLKVKFSLQFGDVLGIFCSLLLLRRAFFENFLFMNRTIVLLELSPDEPIRCHASTSFGETQASISSNILITFCSTFWSGTLSGIPQISILFFPPYYSHEL